MAISYKRRYLFLIATKKSTLKLAIYVLRLEFVMSFLFKIQIKLIFNMAQNINVLIE